ncbi:hypothetical protein KCP74_14995 [Salmonella enterica subsp. enterica]|nr:hypothetical protein KCP74_14995 [Salmonella enterica subsp. enterica]
MREWPGTVYFATGVRCVYGAAVPHNDADAPRVGLRIKGVAMSGFGPVARKFSSAVNRRYAHHYR